jgi:hypothetical protein
VDGDTIILLGEAIHERYFRKARKGGGSRGLVDLADRRRVSSDSVDWVSTGHVRTSCMALVVVVGPGHNLVVRPDCVVLGHSYYEDMHLALSIGDFLVDAMGKTVEKTSGWLMAGRGGMGPTHFHAHIGVS